MKVLAHLDAAGQREHYIQSLLDQLEQANSVRRDEAVKKLLYISMGG